MMRRLGLVVVLLAGGLVATPAQAQCAIGATTVPFGNVDLLSGTTATATGTVSVNCPGGFGSFPYIWLCTSIGTGTNSVSVNNRTMKSGANTLGYQLYTDSAMTTVYTYAPSNQYSAPYNNSTGGTSNTPVYAKILSGQTSPPGSYTDTYSTTVQAQVSGNVATTLPGNCGGGAAALSVTVTATVVANASVSTTAMNFGSTSTLASNIDATATLTMQATNTTPYSIGLGNGLNASGSQRRARLGAASSFINYNLYTDAARTQAWSTTSSAGSCSGGAGSCVLGTGNGTNQNITVYGRVPSQSVPATGTFNDTVVVTVTF